MNIKKNINDRKDNEVWKPVVGYETFYEISDYGRIKSVDRNIYFKDGRVIFMKSRFLKTFSVRGYLRVSLTKNRKFRKFFVHRLVGEAFLIDFNPNYDIHHKDRNRQNNHVFNLESINKIKHGKLRGIENVEVSFEKQKHKICEAKTLIINNINQKEVKLENEIWKNIDGYEGFYQISNYGQVKSLARTTVFKNSTKSIKEKILQPAERGRDSHKYLFVRLSNSKSFRSFSIHRLVAEAFVENPYNYTLVHHKDCNTRNNQANNLEWVTKAINNLYAYKKIKRKLTEENVQKIRNLYQQTNATRETLAKQFSVSPAAIGKIVHYETWKHIA